MSAPRAKHGIIQKIEIGRYFSSAITQGVGGVVHNSLTLPKKTKKFKRRFSQNQRPNDPNIYEILKDTLTVTNTFS